LTERRATSIRRPRRSVLTTLGRTLSNASVCLGISLIDADFEYGLQATKWQTYADIRKMPSFYEIPGTELNSPLYPISIAGAGTTTVTVTVPSVTSAAVTSVGTVNTTSAVLNFAAVPAAVAIGQGVILGAPTLYWSHFGDCDRFDWNERNYRCTRRRQRRQSQHRLPTFSTMRFRCQARSSLLSVWRTIQTTRIRAEGYYIINSASMSGSNFSITYTSKIGTVTNGTISTSFTSIKRGGTYGGAAVGGYTP
jgi:hypothetical protein